MRVDFLKLGLDNKARMSVVIDLAIRELEFCVDISGASAKNHKTTFMTIDLLRQARKEIEGTKP